MPEMFYTSEAISGDKELGKSIALITDGRFPVHLQVRLSDIAAQKLLTEPGALVEEGDLIEIDVMERKLNIIRNRRRAQVHGRNR